MGNRILCLFFGHKLKQEIIRVSDQAVIIECVRCKNKFAYNHVERIILPYDLTMQEFYRTFNEIKNSRLTDGVADTRKGVQQG